MGLLTAFALFSFACARAFEDGMIAPVSPHKISLQSRSIPKGSSSFRRRALSPTSEPLADFFLGTDLQYVQHLFERILSDHISSSYLGGLGTFQVLSASYTVPSTQPNICALIATQWGHHPRSSLSVLSQTGCMFADVSFRSSLTQEALLWNLPVSSVLMRIPPSIYNPHPRYSLRLSMPSEAI